MPQQLIVIDGLTCPNCGRPESNPDKPGHCFIRGFKVCASPERGWESECLVCCIWFDEDMIITCQSDRKVQEYQAYAEADAYAFAEQHNL